MQPVGRVLAGAREALAEELAGIALTLAGQLGNLLLGWLASCNGGLCDEVLEELARRGCTDPTLDDVLSILEERSDRVDFGAALSAAPAAVQALVASGLIIARRLGGGRVELSREKLVEYARRRGAEEVAQLLERYPRLAGRLVEWLKAALGG
ncbi:MAG: hypothetical protein QXT28_06190 [Thermofilaceae archaeon]